MYLEPVRISRDDIDKIDTTVPTVFNNIIISVNTRVVTYQETAKTDRSGCPAINELFHNTAEEFYRVLSLVTLMEYSFRLIFQASFLLRFAGRRKSPRF